MNHQSQVIKIINRPRIGIVFSSYFKMLFILIFVMGTIGLFIGYMLHEFTIAEIVIGAIVFFFMSLVLAGAATAGNDKFINIDSEKMLFHKNYISIDSANDSYTLEIPVQRIENIMVEFYGTDEGPKHWINYRKHKTGGNNFIKIQDKEGNVIEREFYGESLNQIKRLRNNLEYYQTQGIKVSIKKVNHVR